MRLRPRFPDGVSVQGQHALLRIETCHLAQLARLRAARPDTGADYGFVLEEGQAHLGLARCLIALRDRQAATESLQRAHAIFSRLDAIALIQEVDGHLAEASAAP